MQSYTLCASQKRKVLILAFLGLGVICIIIDFSWLEKWSNLQQTFTNFTLPPKCTRPVENVMFLKIHKTGSSTLTNILNRFADQKELDVVLPPKHLYSFYWPHKFQLNFVEPLHRIPNILCNHARFNEISLNVLLPKTRAKYITILREPVSHYESVFYFFHFDYFLRTNNSLMSINRFLSGDWAKMMLAKLRPLVLAKNPMLFDLGLELGFYQNFTAVKEYIDFLDSEFDFVLILEYFDESLVLLKRLFCWETKYIVYVKQMERLKSEKNREAITDGLKRKILSWNNADHMLYKHFNATLWKKIHLEGPAFYEDLKLFRQELQRIKDECLEKGIQKKLAYNNRHVRGYNMKPNVSASMETYCQKLLFNEIDYIKYFRGKKQQQKQKQSKKQEPQKQKQKQKQTTTTTTTKTRTNKKKKKQTKETKQKFAKSNKE